VASNAEYEAAVERAIAAIALAVKDDEWEPFRTKLMNAVALRGGRVEGGVHAGILNDVYDEVLERFVAKLAAALAPRMERISSEVAEAVDQQLADALADIKARRVAAKDGAPRPSTHERGRIAPPLAERN